MKYYKLLLAPLLIFFLFLINQLFAPFGWLVDLTMAAVIFFNLNRIPGRWSAFITAAVLLDLTYDTPGIYILAWLLLAFCLNLLTAEFSLSNQLARWFLTLGSVAGYWLSVFCLSRLCAWISHEPYYALFIKLSVWQFAVYLLVNTLIIVLAGQIFYRLKKTKYVENFRSL